jgi:sirohydrochlorin cobaltochelatase
MKTGLVILAHGARDPRWAEPFERLREVVQQRAPSAAVRLAYLESMQPDLTTAVTELIGLAATAIRVVPIFFGQGGHVREDLPRLIAKLAQDHPEVEIGCTLPAGEAPEVIEALAGYCLDGLHA